MKDSFAYSDLKLKYYVAIFHEENNNKFWSCREDILSFKKFLFAF